MWLNIPGFTAENDERYGDGQILVSDDRKTCIVIDAFMGKGKQLVIDFLLALNPERVILILTHPHCDHGNGLKDILYNKKIKVVELLCYNMQTLARGLRNNKGSDAVRDDISYGEGLIALAKKKGVKVRYIDEGDTISYGGIKALVYRDQPQRVEDDDEHGWEYVNNGSLGLWFPEIGYLTTGDGPESIYEFCVKRKIKAVVFKITHHGGSCNRPNAKGMKALGAIMCWYNHLEPNGVGTTSFTAFGARRCKEAGIKTLCTIGDINAIFAGGKAYWYHGGQVISYKCSYKGKSSLGYAGASVIRQILRGTYGNSDTRITRLIRAGFWPSNANSKVTKVIRLAKQIKEGTELGKSYGKNQTRLNRIDAELGKGYGQLVQDYINVLYGIRKAV